MVESETTQELIVRLLVIGGASNIDDLFGLLVIEAPELVGAKECSIFWKDGAWRNPWRNSKKAPPDAFYRRATYEAKKHLIGIDYYLPGEGLTGWVGKHGASLRVNDITNHEELFKIAPDLHWKAKGKGFADSPDPDQQLAFLAVPVKIGRG